MKKDSELNKPVPAELPAAFAQALDGYLNSLDLERSLSANTRDNYSRDLKAFTDYLEAALPGARIEEEARITSSVAVYRIVRDGGKD